MSERSELLFLVPVELSGDQVGTVGLITDVFYKGIADKLRKAPRPMEYYAFDPGFKEDELEVLNHMREVCKYLLWEELKRLNDRINNHHHVTLNLSDGYKFRDNGNRVVPWDEEDKKHGGGKGAQVT